MLDRFSTGRRRRTTVSFDDRLPSSRAGAADTTQEPRREDPRDPTARPVGRRMSLLDHVAEASERTDRRGLSALTPRRGRSVRSIRGGVAMDFEVSETDGDHPDDGPRVRRRRGHPARGRDAPRDRRRRCTAMVAAAQAKVRQMGLWAPNHPVEFGGLGSVDGRSRPVERGARAHPARAPRVRLAGARRRQHRDPPPPRHRRATRAVPAPAGRGPDPQLLLDDRAGDGRVEPVAARDHRRQGRRRLRDQRPEVVHVVGRRRGVRDRDGRHRSRRAAARSGPA